MRVVLNQSTALGARTGVGHYTAELLKSLRALAPMDRLDAFPPSWWGQASRLASRVRSDRGQTSAAALPKPASAPYRDRFTVGLRNLERQALSSWFRLRTRMRSYDLYHEPNFIPLPSDIPTVVTLHDLSVLLHPDWHPADRVAHYERYFHRGLKNVRHFLTVSEFTRQEVMRLLGVPAECVTRTYLGIRSNLKPLSAEATAEALQSTGLRPGYLLFVGTIEPRKNPLLLMRAYCDLPAALRERCPLILAGGWGWNTAPIAEFHRDEARHRGVVQLGYVGESRLAALYNGARALVFPSLYEGFGLPPLEMMACGGAVLASNAGSIAETVAGRAHLIDPHDLAGWRAALERVIQDDDWHASLRRGVVEWAARYSWENCAAETIRVYRQVCEGEQHTMGSPLQAA
jgi:alpha-1,3-rhamnosyl/mannosyltransferase